MKATAYLITLLAVVCSVLAVDVQKAFVVHFPSNTPGHVVDDAIQTVTKAGGVITHQYSLIKGFAATAGEKVFLDLQSMAKALESTYTMTIEEDKVISQNGRA